MRSHGIQRLWRGLHGVEDLAGAAAAGALGPLAGRGFCALTEPGLSGAGEFAARRIAGSITSFGVSTEAKSFFEDQ